jgi:hypothetical protein
MSEITRICRDCKVDSKIGEFIACFTCKIITHICSKSLKNGKVDENFIKTSIISGFKYICPDCSPSINSYSIAINNLRAQLSDLNKGMDSVIKSINELNGHNQSSSNNADETFASVLRESTIVITPKDPNVTTEAMKDKVRKSIDPESSKITGLRATNNNKVILKSGNPDSNLFASSVSEKLGENFEIKVHDPNSKRLKLVRFENQGYSNEEIITTMRNQNPAIADCTNFQIVKENKNNTNTKLSTLIIQTDATTHRRVLELGSINFKWNHYKVYDTFGVSRCYKCCRFGHLIKDCKAESAICPRCSENHEIKDCKSDNKKCINCAESVSKFHLDLNISHPAYSNECPTMLFKLSKLKTAYTRKF